MFLLFTVRDAVRIAPTNFGAPWGPGLHDEIDSRYANRVIPGVGLVVSCADVLHCGDAVLPAGDGAAFADGAWPLCRAPAPRAPRYRGRRHGSAPPEPQHPP